MAAKKTTPTAMDYIVSYLKRKPQASYQEIKDGAEKQRLTVYPIMYGRAQALLGLVPSRPRGSKKKAAAKAAGRKASSVSSGAARSGGGSPIETLQELVSGMRDQERSNDELRRTLERIKEMIDKVV